MSIEQTTPKTHEHTGQHICASATTSCPVAAKHPLIDGGQK